MKLHRIIPLLLLAAACGSKKSTKNEKVVEPPAPAAATSAPTAAPGAPAAAPAVAATRLGNFDLTATAIDPAALYPGAKMKLNKADGGGVDGYGVDTLTIEQDGKTVAEIELEGGKASALRVYETPPFERIAREHPGATCVEDKWGVSCSDGPFTWLLDGGMEAEWGSEAPIAQVRGATKADWIAWAAPEGKRPTVTLPAGGGRDDEQADDNGYRKPTAEEVTRCARLQVITQGCGFGHDEEFGWVKGKPAKLTLAAAQKNCDVEQINTEDGPLMPVPLFDEGKVAAMEQAARSSCGKLRTELEKYGLFNEHLP